MKTRARDLTEQQQTEFADEFYSICGFDDRQCDMPWGCPWYHGGNIYLEGNSIEEMAENYFEKNKKEIEHLLQDEADQRDHEG